MSLPSFGSGQVGNRLMGVLGKALDEEPPGRLRTIEFFSRFKQDHPGQVVLLH